MRILKNVVRSLKNFVELFQMSLDHKQLNKINELRKSPIFRFYLVYLSSLSSTN
jgi:hypothetical protein